MSIGQAAFFGIGAYHAAILMQRSAGRSWLVLPIAALACFIIGLALGFPALRVQHHYLAFATLGFNVLVYPRDAQRGEADRRHVRHLRHPAAVAFRLFARRHAARSSISRFASLIVLALAAVVAAALAVGPRVRGAARQPDPRREPRRQHHRVHAARVRDRRGVRGHRRRVLRRAGPVHRARRRSTSRRRS